MLWRVSPRPGRVPASFIQPCLAVDAAKVPAGPGWAHEIKHDGYRLQVHKKGDRVRLYTRRGFDWTERYPRIVAAAQRIGTDFILDGECVCTNTDGIADFAKLHSRYFDDEVFFYAFDLMKLGADDLRPLPLGERKDRLRKLIRRPNGIHFCDHDDGDGDALFRAACRMGLEGIISKRIDSPYKPGPKRCQLWVKVKNKHAPGYMRVRDGMEG